jgi:hypothetical protein
MIFRLLKIIKEIIIKNKSFIIIYTIFFLSSIYSLDNVNSFETLVTAFCKFFAGVFMGILISRKIKNDSKRK